MMASLCNQIPLLNRVEFFIENRLFGLAAEVEEYGPGFRFLSQIDVLEVYDFIVSVVQEMLLFHA